MDANLEEFRSHLLQGAAELPELKLWQLQELGLQAAQRAATAGPSFALGVMRDLAQNLPVQAKPLARTQVSKELRQEIKKNQKVGGGGTFDDQFGSLIDCVLLPLRC